MILLSTAT